MTGPSLIYICGPTASGKSALALEMAEKLDGEIVNADAFQLYRGLEMVSAAPSLEERARVPHHLYGVMDPAEAADAGSLYAARPAGDRGHPNPRQNPGHHRRLRTLSEIPDPRSRAAARRGCRAARRTRRPPAGRAGRATPTVRPGRGGAHRLANRRFVSRALEICLLTGGQASALRDQWEGQTRAISASLRGYVIHRPRPDLHARIAARTRAMLDGGAIEEVARLTQVSPNCEKAIGFREIRALHRRGHRPCHLRGTHQCRHPPIRQAPGILVPPRALAQRLSVISHSQE